MPDSALRQRKGPSLDNGTSKRDAEDEPIWLDLLRILSFLLCASCGLSYLISGGESFLWGMQQKPDYMRSEWWKAKFSGPIYLTPEELRSYDGSDASKPVYLAINGTIYDVSNGRQIYGPGGSYNFFAGVDASRAYVTGCFREDLTPDMRGVELMYLPLDDPATDAHWTAAEMAQLREEEMEKARAKVHKGLKHWVDFFAKSKKYNQVGYLKRDDDWLEQLEPRELCASAQKSRKKRKVPQNS